MLGKIDKGKSRRSLRRRGISLIETALIVIAGIGFVSSVLWFFSGVKPQERAMSAQAAVYAIQREVEHVWIATGRMPDDAVAFLDRIDAAPFIAEGPQIVKQPWSVNGMVWQARGDTLRLGLRGVSPADCRAIMSVIRPQHLDGKVVTLGFTASHALSGLTSLADREAACGKPGETALIGWIFAPNLDLAMEMVPAPQNLHAFAAEWRNSQGRTVSEHLFPPETEVEPGRGFRIFGDPQIMMKVPQGLQRSGILSPDAALSLPEVGCSRAGRALIMIDDGATYRWAAQRNC